MTGTKSQDLSAPVALVFFQKNLLEVLRIDMSCGVLDSKSDFMSQFV